MKLLTKKLRQEIPLLRAQSDKGDDAIVYAHLFTPDAQWSWFITEFDGVDTCFGLVVGSESELGYFRLSELSQIRGCFGLPVERDRYFPKTTLGKLRDKGGKTQSNQPV